MAVAVQGRSDQLMTRVACGCFLCMSLLTEGVSAPFETLSAPEEVNPSYAPYNNNNNNTTCPENHFLLATRSFSPYSVTLPVLLHTRCRVSRSFFVQFFVVGPFLQPQIPQGNTLCKIPSHWDSLMLISRPETLSIVAVYPEPS